MKYWKKILCFLWVTLFSIGFVGAQYDNETFQTIHSSDLNFQAKVVDGEVQMSWDAFTQNKEYGFSYYKVVRSFDKNNPYYPEDGYISYISDINSTSYTDKDRYSKKAYYRVCAIAYDKGKYRFCSDVVSVTKSDSQEVKKWESPKKDIQKDTSSKNILNKKVQAQLDNIFNKYKNKIENKFSQDEQKIEMVDAIIQALSKHNGSEKQKLYVNYLIEKFTNYKNTLSEWIGEIDSLIENLLK